jgi:phage terminase large subunit-like protein
VYRDVVEVPSTGAIYRVLSADAKLQQGLNPSTVIFDEVHVSAESRPLGCVELGMGARKDPHIIGITTAGFDPDTLCGRLYNYGKRVISGDQVDERFGCSGGKHQRVVLFRIVMVGLLRIRTWLKGCSTWKTWK